MTSDKILLTPGQVQKLLDWIEIIPTEHYICISRNIDTNKIYISDCGKTGLDYGEELEIREESDLDR